MRDPEWIPCTINIQGAHTWRKYGKKLEDLILRYPSFKYLLKQRETLLSKGSSLSGGKFKLKGKTLVDEWGCEWYHVLDGVEGEVKKHPLEDWSRLDSYVPPPYNPVFNNTPPERRLRQHSQLERDWDDLRKTVEKAKNQGRITIGWVEHGFLFLRLCYLRGFNNFMMDTIREPPELKRLIEIVVDYNMKLVKKWLEIGVDIVGFGDDLGSQKALMINPKAFRKFIFPAYAKIFGAVRAAGAHVYFHTDGHVLEIADELIKSGVSILNIRIFQNEGIEAVKKAFKGKVCLDVGTDKQFVIPWGSPKDVRNYVKDLVLKLGSKKGGLILTFNLGGYDMCEVPLANIEALFQAIEEYKYYFWK